MIKYFTILCCLFTSGLFAQTQITSPTVSGTWTLSGSPYIINNAISINNGTSLSIQAGVVVKFKSGTKLIVNGSLSAIGTASQYISFQADDTVGWSNENTPNGGWSGIHFMQWSGTSIDNSALAYCKIHDTKYGYSTYVADCNTLTISRKLKVSYTEIYHNTAGTGLYVAGDNIAVNALVAADTIELDHCSIYDNTSVFGILHNNNFSGGFTHIHHCEFHDNIKGSPIWGTWNNILIEYNDIHHNDMINDSAPIKLSVGNGRIYHNKVHHNTCDQLAAIGCRSGFIDIDDNLICNNQQMDGGCGATGGGGGIHLSFNEGATTFANTYYRVRNNVIANNYSAYGGGGIYVFTARAEISNNTIVNNTSATFNAKAIMVLNPLCEVFIKNNLFKGNSTPGSTDSMYTIGVYSANKIQVDNNYLPTNYSQAVMGIGGFNLIGDTVHNVIGNAPQLITPTTNNNYNTDATSSNFGIQSTSPCVDKGDSTATNALPTDYAGNPRISGTKIDIGAYEISKANWVNETNQSTFEISMFPNPASSTLHLKLPFTHSNLLITDINGRTIVENTLNEDHTVIDLSTWPSGLYLVRCLSDGHIASRRMNVYH